MKLISLLSNLKPLYNFFLFLALINIFFSTGKSYAKTFSINDIEISTPFEINFNKNEIINEGFVEAFNELIYSIVQSKDQLKLKNTSINQIKGMIETFSIKEEKFIDEIYYLALDVSFNKKNIFDLLESKNIFPSLSSKKNFLFFSLRCLLLKCNKITCPCQYFNILSFLNIFIPSFSKILYLRFFFSADNIKQYVPK